MKRLLSMLAAAAMMGCAGDSLPPRSTLDSSTASSGVRAVPPRTIPMLIVVERGDTLYGLARHWGVTPQVVIDTNRLAAPYRLLIGQKLIMPLPASDEPLSETMVAARDSGVATPRTDPTVTSPVVDTPSETAAALPLPAEPSPPAPAPEPGESGSRFIWPVSGNVISAYGTKGSGLQNDGIDIAAPAGTPVRAAAKGVVAYAGNELQGYGNIVLIRHANGWMTAYAHNQELLVKAGDSVAQGQIIARVGSSGRVNRSLLHFEIRRGRQPLDPMDYLPRSTA